MLSQQRLVERFASAKGEEPDGGMIEIDLGANESLSPVRSDGKGVAEDRGHAAIVGAADEDERASRTRLESKLEVGRERDARWRTIDACSRSKMDRSYPSLGAQFKNSQRFVIEASPDLCLPTAVETFDGILEARLTWRREHWCDAEQQTGSHDLTDDIGELVRTLEDGRVVELRIARKTKLFPSTQQRLDDTRGGDRQGRPAGGQASMQRHAIEDLDLDSASQDQAADGVEGIEFGAPGSNFRKVPTDRRRGLAYAAAPVQNAQSLQDATDRPCGGNLLNSLFDERRADRVRSDVSQIAHSQLATHPQHELLGLWVSSVDRPRCSRRSIDPIDSVEPLARTTSHPPLNREQTHVKLASNAAHRVPAPYGSDDVPTSLLDAIFDSLHAPHFCSAYRPEMSRFSPVPPPSRTGLWNLPGYGKPAKQRRPFHSLWKTPPIHRPRFPQLPQPLLATQKGAVRSNQTKTNSPHQVTWGCCHLSDLGLVAVGP